MPVIAYTAFGKCLCNRQISIQKLFSQLSYLVIYVILIWSNADMLFKHFQEMSFAQVCSFCDFIGLKAHFTI